MAIPVNVPRGLLPDARAKFNPEIPPGLLSMMAMPGQPAAQMAQGMQAAQAAQAAPAAPPAPAPAPAAPPSDESFNDTQRSLMSGGIAAMQAATPEGGGTLGASLGAGLAAGTAAFVARKDAKKDAAIRLEKQAQYEAVVAGLDLPEQAKAGLRLMGPEAGGKFLADNGIKVPELKPVVVERGDGGKNVVAFDPTKGTSTESYRGTAPAAPIENKPDSNVQAYMSVKYPGVKLAELDDAQRAQVWKEAGEYRSTGAANMSQHVAPTGQKPFWDNFGGGAAGAAQARLDAGRKAQATSNLIDDNLSLGSLPTFRGALAEQRLAFAKFGQMLGVSNALNDYKVTNSDELGAAIKNLTLSRLKELDARPTDRDMIVLEKAVGSEYTDPEAFKGLMIRAKRVLSRVIDDADNLYDSMESRAIADGAYLPPTMSRIRPKGGESKEPADGTTSGNYVYDAKLKRWREK